MTDSNYKMSNEELASAIEAAVEVVKTCDPYDMFNASLHLQILRDRQQERVNMVVIKTTVAPRSTPPFKIERFGKISYD